MEEKALKILEFDKVIEQLAAFATSEAGRGLCRKIKPDTDPKRIRTWQQNTSDAKDRIRLKGSSLSFRGVKEIGDSLKRLEIGSALSIPELLAVSSVLTVAARAKAYDRSQGGEEEEERRDSLSEYFSFLEPLTPVNNEIRRCIISEEEVADDASPGLSRVRRRMKQTADQIHSGMAGLLNSAFVQWDADGRSAVQ